ncbi:unnamed protein product, partial [Meganyctiphanes norvegica]
DWKDDQYKWTCHDGTRRLPRTNPTYIKSYHALDRTRAFKREGWRLISNPSIVLVHYIGDHTTYTPKPPRIYPNSPKDPKSPKPSRIHGNIKPTPGLKLDEAIRMLQEADPSSLPTKPPIKPKGGEMFLVNCGDDVNKQNDWKCDQYNWRYFCGTRKLPKSNPVVNKVFNYLDLNRAFRREVW